jgi:hypothetical protein
MFIDEEQLAEFIYYELQWLIAMEEFGEMMGLDLDFKGGDKGGRDILHLAMNIMGIPEDEDNKGEEGFCRDWIYHEYYDDMQGLVQKRAPKEDTIRVIAGWIMEKRKEVVDYREYQARMHKD